MKSKLLAVCLPLGLLMMPGILLVNRYVVTISDAVAIPLMVLGVILLITGIAYTTYCVRNKINPFTGK